ncbi:GNVR domain-containing protein [Aliarcobacter faecis]|uniref:GNVR domain-containing protein n=1 Tax=Aliarcobacter faecis TaxID=1564138 RepID=UPI00138AC630|nr:GNVR domain-containing protein [Aliarcobacter faecis]
MVIQLLNTQNLILSLQNIVGNLIKEKEDLLNIKLKDLEKKVEELKNSDIVGELITNDFPIKPKKSLIIVVAFITGFIFSIFLVFFLNFIQSFKEKN